MKTILIGNNYYIRTMKKYILPLMSIAMLMSMASCSSSDDEVAEIKEESKLVPMTFTATQESNAGTRSALSTGNSVIWQTSDKISVFDGYNDTKHNRSFTLEGDGGEKSGSFTGTASSSATTFTAVYPYTEGATLGEDGSVSGITLPAVQTATAGSFDPAAALMMAVSTEGNKNQLDFKNAISLVKVTPQFDCTKIELEVADGSGDILAGKGTLNWNGGNPKIIITEETSKTITLNGSIAKGNSYCIVVPTGTINRMWKISFTAKDDEKKYTRYCSKLLTIERNKIINLGNFATDSPFWADEHRGNKVTYEQEVDLGLTFIGDNKKYKVIFANANLTATGLAENEYDFGDYFAWGATEPWCTQYSRTGTGYDVQVSPTAWENTKNAKVYDWTTVPFRDGNNWSCNQYINDGEKLAMKHDAARQILQGDWQIPTKEIWDKLCETSKYEWTKTSKAKYNGYQVKSKKSETGTIFLPVAGEVNNSSLSGAGTYGSYWSGTAKSNDSAYSLYLYLNYSEGNKDISPKYRYYGYSVRPVRLVVESLAEPVATTETYGSEKDFKWE